MHDSLANSLSTARENLVRAVRMSKQAAYARRAPEPNSIPQFEKTRDILDDILRQDPRNCEALVMMSQVFESLMDFNGAVALLNRAFEAGEPKTKKSLKRLALLRENAAAWTDFLLSPAQLRELGNYLERAGVGPGHRTMDLTSNWLNENGIKNPETAIAQLEQRGAFSDFQVLSNIVCG